jgi:hypothetical protein
MLVSFSRLREVICSRGDAETRRLQFANGSFSLQTSRFPAQLIEGASRKFAQLLRVSASPREHFLILRWRA